MFLGFPPKIENRKRGKKKKRKEGVRRQKHVTMKNGNVKGNFE